MRTPTAALAWELWQRHRQRILAIAGVLLVFVLAYPKLCAMAGFDPDAPDAADEVGRFFAPIAGRPTILNIFQALFLLFLAGGPAVAMVLTLLCTIYMFTFAEAHPKTKGFMSFPDRLFQLPISTPFLFRRLLLGGLAAVLGLCAAWDFGVHQPHLEIFRGYQSCFGWMTLLVLGQAIAWSLDAWPITRMLTMMAVVFSFLVSPLAHMLMVSPYLLPPLFLVGVALGWVGLQKMRRGQWQGWQGSWPVASRFRRAELRGPKQFSSPAQAQLWFEWRRSAARLCLLAAALALIAAIIPAIRAAAGYPPLTTDGMVAFALALCGIPVVIFGLQGVSPTQSDQSFLLIRPLREDEMVMPILKANAIAALLSWVAVLAVSCILPWLGDAPALAQRLSPEPGRRIALVLGLIFLTWRGSVINLCFVLTGSPRISQAPVGLWLAAWMSFTVAFLLDKTGVHFDWFWNHVAELAAGLVALKLLAAGLGFRAGLKQRLLSARTMFGYLSVWSLLVGASLATLLLLAHPDSTLMVPACLGVVLLVPLARIAYSPFALAWARHQADNSAHG